MKSAPSLIQTSATRQRFFRWPCLGPQSSHEGEPIQGNSAVYTDYPTGALPNETDKGAVHCPCIALSYSKEAAGADLDVICSV